MVRGPISVWWKPLYGIPSIRLKPIYPFKRAMAEFSGKQFDCPVFTKPSLPKNYFGRDNVISAALSRFGFYFFVR